MTLSREARILLGILGVLGLSFAWLHFSTQESTPAAVSTPNRERPNADAALSPQRTTEQTGSQLGGQADEPADQAAERAAPTVGQDGVIDGVPDSTADEPRVARDLQIAQLPFLVTSPPAEASAPADFDNEFDPETGQIPTTQTQSASSSQRASVNPFSPLVVAQADPVPDQDTPGTQIADVPISPQPQTASAPVPPAPRRAPVPSARTPDAASTLSASRLPRSLPGGTLSSTPDVLRQALSTPDDVQRTENPLTGDDADAAPLAASSSPLSLYLRDQQLTFTGAVLGPVSVGIFRSADAPAPFLVPLGQTLPNTDIVLTDLTGQRAELTQNDDSQLLILDLRR